MLVERMDWMMVEESVALLVEQKAVRMAVLLALQSVGMTDMMKVG